MTRTVERILGTVGIIMDIITAFLGLLIIGVILFGFYWLDVDAVSDSQSFYTIIMVFKHLLFLPVIGCAISIILGALGVYYAKRKPGTAGILFIIAAVVSFWLLLVAGAFQSLLYLTAGLMCLFRKPPAPTA